MSRLLAALSLALPLSGALAVNPTDQLVEEIVELSKQVGDQGEVVGDQKDFAEALRRIASDRPEGGGWQAPPPQPTNRVAWPESDGTGPDPSGRNLVGAAWPPHAANPYGERPHGPTPPPRKPPHIMLREAAFQLDRIAHELEMTELFAEADALRDTADKLRKSARKKPPKPQSGPGKAWGQVPTRSRSHRSDDHERRMRLPKEAREMLRQQGEAWNRYGSEPSRRLQPPPPPRPAEPPRPVDE